MHCARLYAHEQKWTLILRDFYVQSGKTNPLPPKKTKQTCVKESSLSYILLYCMRIIKNYKI